MPSMNRMLWIIGLALLAQAITARVPAVRQIVIGA